MKNTDVKSKHVKTLNPNNNLRIKKEGRRRKRAQQEQDDDPYGMAGLAHGRWLLDS